MMGNGYVLRTAEGPNSEAFRLAGPRSSHPDITFPLCPACQVPRSPIFRLDFDEPRLAELGLWSGPFVALVCHNRCWPADRLLDWYDYGDPKAPTLLQTEGICRPDPIDVPWQREPFVPPVEDPQFEAVAVTLTPRGPRDPEYLELDSAVGGRPSWLQEGEPFPRCLQCVRQMAFLLQWSEAGMDHVPRRLHSDRPQVLGNPFIRFWFGCPACRLVASFEQLD